MLRKHKPLFCVIEVINGLGGRQNNETDPISSTEPFDCVKAHIQDTFPKFLPGDWTRSHGATVHWSRLCPEESIGWLSGPGSPPSYNNIIGAITVVGALSSPEKIA